MTVDQCFLMSSVNLFSVAVGGMAQVAIALDKISNGMKYGEYI